MAFIVVTAMIFYGVAAAAPLFFFGVRILTGSVNGHS
jgi:hypothetical protein